jgi:hypothetical protein
MPPDLGHLVGQPAFEQARGIVMETGRYSADQALTAIGEYVCRTGTDIDDCVSMLRSSPPGYAPQVCYLSRYSHPARWRTLGRMAFTAHFHGGPWDLTSQEHDSDPPPLDIRISPDMEHVGASGLPIGVDDGEPIALVTDSRYVLRDRSNADEPHYDWHEEPSFEPADSVAHPSK